MQKVECLIVGGGICGRLLQLNLEQRGINTLVYDSPSGNHCTAVAAGLANPLVGKFFTVGWRANEFFPHLASFYANLEKRLSTSFFRPRLLKRIISTAGEQNIWLSKAHQSKYVGFCSFAHEDLVGLNTHFGVLNVLQGGELDTRSFLEGCDSQLNTRKEDIDYTKLDLINKEYNGVTFDKIIFAEGHKLRDNPIWNKYIKVVPTKGELLVIETDLEPHGSIYLGSVFMQHLCDNRWRVGSTYNKNDATLHPTAMMKDDLVTKLEKVLQLPYKVIDHYCGIRPASVDRKPLLGEHPEYKNSYVVNGMGSKAVSMAPVLVDELVDYMYGEGELHESVLLNRF